MRKGGLGLGTQVTSLVLIVLLAVFITRSWLLLNRVCAGNGSSAADEKENTRQA